MRKWRFRRREALPQHVREELDVWIAVLLGLGALLMLYATLGAQAARAAEFPEVGAGTLVFQAANGGFERAAPLSTDIRVSVAGIVARVRVAQRFRNPSSNFLEAVYVLPLPDDAAVDRLLMQVGERVVEGEIQERQQAERTYGAARAAGQRTSLVRQTSANLFTTAVANIPPGEAIDITIEYLQTARYDAGEFSLRVPLTLTPRYGSGDTPEARSTVTSATLPEPHISIESALAAGSPSTPAHSAEVRAVLAPGLPLATIGSRGHPMSVLREQGTAWSAAAGGKPGATVATATTAPPSDELYVLDTVTPRVPMDRDLVIAWRPLVGAEPVVTALTETRGDTTYALLMIVPPESTHGRATQPREQIYVIDTSGSMAGQSLAQAQAALKDALGRLTAADRFNVIQFNSVTARLFAAPEPATPQSQAQALRYVEGLAANGGTEIGPAIAAALAQPLTPGYLRQVVFLTDGAVAGETALFAAIRRELGTARLFTIGIGAAPNSHFMRKAAQFGRGTYTHIGATSEVTEKMQALFAKLERIALTDLVVDWPAAVEVYPQALPDVYAGEPLVIAASYPAATIEPLRTTVYGRAAAAPWQDAIASTPSELPGIATLWARRKIEQLLDGRVAGTGEALIRKLVLETALEHQLVSPYTSLVAVDKTPVRTPDVALERKDIANVTPAGAQWTTGLPQTATPAPLLRLLGTLAFLLAAVCGLNPRRPSKWRVS